MVSASFVADIEIYRDLSGEEEELVLLALPPSTTKAWNAARYREMARYCSGGSFQVS